MVVYQHTFGLTLLLFTHTLNMSGHAIQNYISPAPINPINIFEFSYQIFPPKFSAHLTGGLVRSPTDL